MKSLSKFDTKVDKKATKIAKKSDNYVCDAMRNSVVSLQQCLNPKQTNVQTLISC